VSEAQPRLGEQPLLGWRRRLAAGRRQSLGGCGS
jgi:hypothetical protein